MTRLEVLRPFVEQTVKEFLGVEELKVLDDGTIPIRAGSSAVNVSFGGETFFEGSPADETPQDATASNEADPNTEAKAEPGGYL